ncbi:MAG: hypothetical protein HOP19_05730 [Acidobacteria bacterium]|nr:hypothetical protein [Acidobacteriota bacterium]
MTAFDLRYFFFDKPQRLTSEAHTNQPSQSFTYDQVGNRTNAPSGGAPTYSANNRLMSYNGLTFTYDLNGNRETQTSAVGTNVYSYDNENRLINVLLPDSTMIQYKYDALGRRVERNRNGGASWERYSYDGANVVKDIRSDGVTVEYGNGLGIDDKLWQKEGTGAAKFFTVDHLGSTRGLTDANGASVDLSSYDAYGNSVTGTVTRYGYTGREADAETGLMYYRARFYDPAVGLFVSEDPIGLLGGINLYGYVGNDPFNSVDPDGLRQKRKRRVKSTGTPTTSLVNWAAIESSTVRFDDAGRFCKVNDISHVKVWIADGLIPHAFLEIEKAYKSNGTAYLGYHPSNLRAKLFYGLGGISDNSHYVLDDTQNKASRIVREYEVGPETLNLLKKSILGHQKGVFQPLNMGAENCAGWVANRLYDAGINAGVATGAALSPYGFEPGGYSYGFMNQPFGKPRGEIPGLPRYLPPK